MKALSKEEVRSYELDLLMKFVKFCERNNLRYYLSSGTLLGAVRHNGFIPWDDDIDVSMPYNDYILFLQMFEKNCEKRYKVFSFELGNTCMPFAKLYDTHVHIQTNEGFVDEKDYLWMDIFPLTNTFDNIKKHDRLWKKCSFYLANFWMTNGRVNRNCTLKKKILTFPVLLFYKVFDGKFWSKKLLKCVKKVHKKNKESKYCSCLVWGWSKNKERIEKIDMNECKHVLFENKNLYTFGKYKNYLRQLYGNYEQLPPVSKRINHDVKAYVE